MRKITELLIMVGLIFSFILHVSAKELTLNEIINNFKNTSLQGSRTCFEQVKKEAIIKTEGNTFTIFCDVAGTKIETKFNYENGWINYQLDGDKNSIEITTKVLIEQIWIEHIIYIIGIIHVYNYDDIVSAFEDGVGTETVKITYFTSEYKEEGLVQNFKE